MTSKSWGDLKKLVDDASRPLPKDWYDVVVSKADAATASTGSLMIKAQLKVVGGPYNNRMLFTNFVLSTENSIALSIFFRNMTAFGLDDAFFAQLTGADTDPEIGLQTVAQTLIGRTARAEVGIRTWQGQERNEVGQFTRPQSGIGTATPVVHAVSNSAPVPGGLGSASAPVPHVPQTAYASPTPQVPQTSTTPIDGPPDIPAF